MLRKEIHIVPRRFGHFLAAAALVCTAVQTPPARAQSGPSIVLTGMQKAPGYFRFQAQISQGKLPVGNGVFNKVYVRLRNGTGAPVASEEFTAQTVRDGVLNLEVGQTNAAAFEQAIANNPQLQVEICIENTTNCMSPVTIASVPYAIKASYAYNARYAQNAAYASECSYTHRAAGEDVTWTGKDGEGIGYLNFTSPIPPSATGTPAAVAGLNINPTTNKAGYIQWMSMDPAKHELHLCGIQAGARKPLDLLVMHADLAKFSGNVQVTGSVNAASLTAAGAVRGATVTATGAVSGATVSATGAVSGGSVSATGMATFGAGLTIGTANVSGGAVTTIYGPATFGAPAATEVTTFNGPTNFIGKANFTLPPGALAGNNSVSSDAIMPGTIVSSNIKTNTILSSNISDGTITADDIANGTVTGAKIAVGTITSGNIFDGTIQGVDIAPGTIDSAKIANGAIKKEHLYSSSVRAFHLDTKLAQVSSPATATKPTPQVFPTGMTLCILSYEHRLGTGAYCSVIFTNSTWLYSNVAYRADCQWLCF